MTTSLIDGDLVAYRCAASAEQDSAEIAIIRTDKLVREILDTTQASHYQVFLSGERNFRKELFPLYKANRTQPKPIHLETCREFLCSEWGARITDGIEADDALGVRQCELGDESIIVSIDKDMLQIPGQHYNFVRNEFYHVMYMDGVRHFYRQLLIGDRADNITGVRGIGEKKAAKLINSCETPDEMFEIVQPLYNDDEWLLLMGNMLYIWQTENDKWHPEQLKHLSIGPHLFKQGPEALLESTPMTQEEAPQCMGPTT